LLDAYVDLEDLLDGRMKPQDRLAFRRVVTRRKCRKRSWLAAYLLYAIPLLRMDSLASTSMGDGSSASRSVSCGRYDPHALILYARGCTLPSLCSLVAVCRGLVDAKAS
jgi:hypothetical protein